MIPLIRPYKFKAAQRECWIDRVARQGNREPFALGIELRRPTSSDLRHAMEPFVNRGDPARPLWRARLRFDNLIPGRADVMPITPNLARQDGFRETILFRRGRPTKCKSTA